MWILIWGSTNEIYILSNVEVILHFISLVQSTLYGFKYKQKKKTLDWSILSTRFI
jgi:hypothetical protein